MKYYYDIKTNLSFDEAQKKVREELMNEGFGVLTEIDVQETLKKKLDVDYDKYLILGACNPPFDSPKAGSASMAMPMGFQ